MKPEEMAEICFEIEAHYRTKRDDFTRKTWIKSMFQFFGTESKETVQAGVRLAMIENDFEPSASKIQRGIDTIRKRKNLKLAEEIFDKLRERAKQKWTEDRILEALSNSRIPEAVRAVKIVGWSNIVDPYPHLITDIKKKFCLAYDHVVSKNKKQQETLTLIDPEIKKLTQGIEVKAIS